MSENSNQCSDSLISEWLSKQQQTIDAWSKVMGHSPKEEEGRTQAEGLDLNSWFSGLQQWWRVAAPVSEQNEQLFQKTVSIGRNYLSLAEQVLASREANKTELDLELWLNKSEAVFQNWSEKLSEQLNETFKDASKSSQTPQPQDGEKLSEKEWRELAQATFSICEKLQSSFGDFKIPGADGTQETFFNLHDAAEKIFGSSLEKDFQAQLKSFFRYKRANAAYSLILAKNGIQGIQNLKEQIQNSRNKQTQADGISEAKADGVSLKVLYNLWVQINEKIYARSALSQDYQKVYGELINSYMAFKKGLDEGLSEKYRQFNLVSRTELDGLLQDQRELRKDNKELRRQLKAMSDKLDAMPSRANSSSANSKSDRQKSKDRANSEAKQ